MDRTARIAPSARLEAQSAELLSAGLGDADTLAELGRLGARLVLQRAVEDKVTVFLGRARYERTPEATGSRDGPRAKRVQTAEGESQPAVPRVRGTVEPLVSRILPDSRAIVRTRPWEALVIGGWVRGPSDRDIERLVQEAGLGQVSTSTASRIGRELRDRYRAFCARSLAETAWLVLFLDAISLPTRPGGAKDGVLVAWGSSTTGQRVLVSVRLGLRSPWLVVSDGAPGLVRAIEQLWPEADRGRCTVHRLRNLLAKRPDRPELDERIKHASWQALDEAVDPPDAERRLRALVAELEQPFPSAAACLADDLPALCVHSTSFPRLRKRFRSSNLLERSLGEVRRRTTVIGRFPGEPSCLSLCRAVLDRVLAGARGLGLSDLELRHGAQLRLARAQPAMAGTRVA
jgi:putative transposase